MLRFILSRVTHTTSHVKPAFSPVVTFALEGLGLASARPVKLLFCESINDDQMAECSLIRTPKRTNITGPPPAGNMSSRGHLVSSFLLSGSPLPLEDEVGAILPKDTRFAGFNMLLLAPSQNSTSDSPTFDACFVSNGGTGGAIHIRPLSEAERRCGGISNSSDSLGAAELSKVKMGKSHLDALLNRHLQEPELVSGLFDILAWVEIRHNFCSDMLNADDKLAA
jgi:hypothetical protein